MKVAIVATSLQIPHELEMYARNARDYGYRDVEFIVLGDCKADMGMSSFCNHLNHTYYPCEYMSMDGQRDYLSEHGVDLWRHLRFDSRQRRIIGLLRAWENGADLILSVEPQDQLLAADFIGSHCHLGQSKRMTVVSSPSGWFNPASFLSESSGQSFFPRGFPNCQRDSIHSRYLETKTVSVAANAGNCLGNGDLDASTHLEAQIKVTGPLPDTPRQYCLAPGTWSPFAGHNLALRRDLIPAYFLSPYVGRCDDIWASFIISRIAGHLGECISFGAPGVLRNSSPANLAKDLQQELIGYRQSDRFCDALRTIQLTGTSYHECFGQIAAGLATAWPELPKSSGIEIEAHSQLISGLGIWHRLFASIQDRSRSNLFENVSREAAQPVQIPVLRQ